MSFRYLHNRTTGLPAAPILFCFVLSGCGGKSTDACKIEAINVFPRTAIVDHNAALPGNTQQFAAFVASVPSGCAVAQSNLTTAKWSVSDAVNVSISDSGTATCKAATTATITATVPAGDGTTVSNSASLTCN